MSCALSIVLAFADTGAVAAADWSASGYLRQYLAVNLDDAPFPRADDRGGISYSRQQVRFDLSGRSLAQLPAGTVDIVASLRFVNEQRTAYQDRLATVALANPAAHPRQFERLLTPLRAGAGSALEAQRYGAFSAIEPGGDNLVPRVNAAAVAAGYPAPFSPDATLFAGDYLDYYRWRQSPLRELYVDVALGARLRLRFGKQQVAFGDTDFFVASDILHGLDLSWGSLSEGAELDELRKALWLANFTYETDTGQWQIVLRPPGLDRDVDIGDTLDLHGGRNAAAAARGIDLTHFINRNGAHALGDFDTDLTGALRYSGRWRDLSYALQWIHSFNLEPTINSCTAGRHCLWATLGLGSTLRAPLGGREPQPEARQRRAPSPAGTGPGYLGEIVHPITDTIGANASMYLAALDAVLATELAYTFDKPLPTGTLAHPSCQLVLCGFAGIVEKDLLRFSVRADWLAQWAQRPPLGLLPIIGAHRPAPVTITLFDSWLPGYSARDDLVLFAGNARARAEHAPFGTLALSLPYYNDRLILGFVAAADLRDLGNGFAIPSIDIAYGDHIRMRVEANLVFNSGQTTGAELGSDPGRVGATRGRGQDTSLFGTFEGRSQMLFKLTYQF